MRCGRGLWLWAIGRGGESWNEDCFRSTFPREWYCKGTGEGEGGEKEKDLSVRLN